MQSSIVGSPFCGGWPAWCLWGFHREDTASLLAGRVQSEMEGVLDESLGARSPGVRQTAARAWKISAQSGQWVSTGERPRLRGEPRRSRAAGCCRQDVSQVEA